MCSKRKLPVLDEMKEIISEENVKKMIEIGVPRERARILLEESENNLELASERFFNASLNSTPASSPVNSSSKIDPSNGSDTLQNALKAALYNINRSDTMAAKQLVELNSLGLPAGASTSDSHDLSNISKEEQEAIEASLQEASMSLTSKSLVSFGFESPINRKRESGTPIGLKNIGQTCYFNSMLQTYFMIPSFRTAVLSLPWLMNSEVYADVNDFQKPSLVFMSELQRLFVRMIYSKEKFCDPTALLSKLVGRDGKTIAIGDQQDVADFNDIFLKSVAKGFEIISELCQHTNIGHISETIDNISLVKRLFYGNGATLLSALEEDGTSLTSSKDTEFSSLIIPIDENPSDLFSGLDLCLCDETDYTTDKGFHTRASRSLWFKAVPELLMFQESRVQFDAQTKSYIKRETPVTFEKEIFIDRYLLENCEFTTERRNIVSLWKKELSQKENLLKSYTNYKGENHGLDEALKSVILYLKEKESNAQSSSSSYSPMIEKLQQMLALEEKVIIDLREEINVLKHKILTAYDELNKTQYSLFAVWIHQGVAGSGHYWAYVCKAVDRWIKFNDMHVSEVDDQQVMKEAIGNGSNHTSAYFLIYMNTKCLLKALKENVSLFVFNELPHCQIPPLLKKEIDESNANFEKELEKYEKSSSKEDQFMKLYQSEILSVEKELKQSTSSLDFRLKSFLIFLESIGQTKMMIAEAVSSTYLKVFGVSLKEDLGSSIYSKIVARLGEEVVANAINMELTESDTKQNLQEKYFLFRDVAELCLIGLQQLLTKNYIEALDSFFSALYYDILLSSFPCRWRSLTVLVHYCSYCCYL